MRWYAVGKFRNESIQSSGCFFIWLCEWNNEQGRIWNNRLPLPCIWNYIEHFFKESDWIQIGSVQFLGWYKPFHEFGYLSLQIRGIFASETKWITTVWFCSFLLRLFDSSCFIILFIFRPNMIYLLCCSCSCF